MSDSETREALRRAVRRAAIHLLRAGVESVKALEAFIDELGKVGQRSEADDDSPRRVRIDVE